MPHFYFPIFRKRRLNTFGYSENLSLKTNLTELSKEFTYILPILSQCKGEPLRIHGNSVSLATSEPEMPHLPGLHCHCSAGDTQHLEM